MSSQKTSTVRNEKIRCAKRQLHKTFECRPRHSNTDFIRWRDDSGLGLITVFGNSAKLYFVLLRICIHHRTCNTLWYSLYYLQTDTAHFHHYVMHSLQKLAATTSLSRIHFPARHKINNFCLFENCSKRNEHWDICMHFRWCISDPPGINYTVARNTFVGVGPSGGCRAEIVILELLNTKAVCLCYNSIVSSLRALQPHN